MTRRICAGILAVMAIGGALRSQNAGATGPVNDNFANRIVLTGTNISVTGSNVGATVEPGEPAKAGNPGGASVWWSWTAPFNARVTLNTAGSFAGTILGVYTGSTLASLAANVVASDLESGPNGTSAVQFNAFTGVTYQIAVDGYFQANFPVATGNIVLNLIAVARPPNDDFVSRASLSGSSVTAATSNIGATKEPGEPNHAGDPGGASLWWTWTAPATRSTLISTIGSDFDTTLAVYMGTTLTNLTQVAANAASPGSHYSFMQFSATAGVTYQIAVDGVQGAEGNVMLNLGPNNDNFANRIALVGTNLIVFTANLLATKEANEPFHAGDPGGASLWWSWKPATNCNATIATLGSSFDTTLAVYFGASVSSNSLAAVVSNDDDPINGGKTSLVTFDAFSTNTYQIAVDGFSGGGQAPTGIVVLTLGVNQFPATLGLPVRLANGVRQITLQGGIGSQYGVQSSPDLKIWQRLSTASSTNGQIVFLDTNAPVPGVQFYRGVSP